MRVGLRVLADARRALPMIARLDRETDRRRLCSVFARYLSLTEGALRYAEAILATRDIGGDPSRN